MVVIEVMIQKYTVQYKSGMHNCQMHYLRFTLHATRATGDRR